MTPRATPMHPDDRRRAILDAVIPLIVDHGEVPSTKQIAEAAGIAEGTIFRVFDDKPSLMRAVAEETMRPSHGREDFEAAIGPIDDLHEAIRVAAESLVTHLHRSMTVMIAVRGLLHLQPRAASSPGPPGTPPGPPAPGGPGTPPGPPQFIVDANRELLEMLTWLFEAHREELRMPPETAAVVLRSLVFGSRHPGMHLAPDLSPAQIADVIVDGVTVPKEA